MPFFGKTLQRLQSSDDCVVANAEHMYVCLSNKQGDIGVTLSNTGDGVGVVVVGLSADGLAKRAGVHVGDIILKVNAHPVGTHAEAVSLIDRAGHGRVELVLG